MKKRLGQLLFEDIYLFSVRGIPISLHSSFLLTWLIFLGTTLVFGGLKTALITVVVMTVAYSIVVLHELGHALTAQQRGYECTDISIFFFGGIASIEGLSYQNPEDEFWITINGPMVNFVLALAGALLAVWVLPGNQFAILFLEINVGMLMFNLLPVYPMDGGRLMRSLLGLNLKNPWLAAKLACFLTVAFAPFIAIWAYSQWSILASVLILIAAAVAVVEFKIILDMRRRQERDETLLQEIMNTPRRVLKMKDMNFLLPEQFDEAMTIYVYMKQIENKLMPLKLGEYGNSYLFNLLLPQNLPPNLFNRLKKGIGKPHEVQVIVSDRIIDAKIHLEANKCVRPAQ